MLTLGIACKQSLLSLNRIVLCSLLTALRLFSMLTLGIACKNSLLSLNRIVLCSL